MAKVFLDTNYFVDALHRKPEKKLLDSLENNTLYISPLSVHIYCYVYKIRIPNEILIQQIEKFQIVEGLENILNSSLKGPTKDFEDNVQLHSAAESECDFFLTADKKLLEMKFFGKVKISSMIT